MIEHHCLNIEGLDRFKALRLVDIAEHYSWNAIVREFADLTYFHQVDMWLKFLKYVRESGLVSRN